MPDRSFLAWPFFEDRHRALAEALEGWASANLAHVDHSDVDQACRELVARLGEGGWLGHSAVDPEDADSRLDVRSLCIIRETLARHDGLADFSFAMQGLGTGALSLFGTAGQKREWLIRTRRGKALSAFALSEPKSGSDVANLDLAATVDGDSYVLNGEKTWISNGGIADLYTWSLRARVNRAPRAFPPLSCLPTRRACRSPNGWRLSRRIRWRGCRSKTAAFRAPPWSARRGRVSASPCRCLTYSGRRLRRRRSASPAARSTNPSPAPRRGNCSARRWPNCRWCRVISPTWRSTSMPRRFWSIAPHG